MKLLLILFIIKTFTWINILNPKEEKVLISPICIVPRDERNLDDSGNTKDFANETDSASFKSKKKITCETGNNGTKDAQVMVPLKYLTLYQAGFLWTFERQGALFGLGLKNCYQSCLVH